MLTIVFYDQPNNYDHTVSQKETVVIRDQGIVDVKLFISDDIIKCDKSVYAVMIVAIQKMY